MRTSLVSRRLLLVVLAANPAPLLHAAADYSTPYFFTTLAGESSLGSVDGTGRNARFNIPVATAAAPDGSLYVADAANHTVRKISPSGAVTTLAGDPTESLLKDGPLGTARFILPTAITLDNAGNVYVLDSHTVRKITSDDQVLTLAGQPGVAQYIDGVGAQAAFADPWNLATDPSGNVYVTERSSHTIRKITPQGVVSTFAGQRDKAGMVDGPAGLATLYYPVGVTSDATGTLYITDGRGIRQVSPAGSVTSIADISHDLSPHVRDITAAPNGDLFYVVETSALWKLPRGGQPVLYAKRLGHDLTPGDFAGPSLDAQGNVYFAGAHDNAVWLAKPDGAISLLAGLPDSLSTGSSDGTGSDARFGMPLAVAVSAAGDLFVADAGASTIRKVTPAGNVSTFVGAPRAAGSSNGPPAVARFNAPMAVAFSRAGHLYVADTGNHTLRVVAPDGTVTTIAGSAGEAGSQDGQGAAARFIGPFNVAVAPDGNAYVYESGRIRQIGPSGTVTTLPGVSNTDMIPDRTAGLAFSPDGRLFLSGLFTVYEMSPTTGAFVRLLVGDIEDRHRYHDGQRYVFGDDGTGNGAHFYNIRGLAFDSAGNLYLTDTGNGTVRKVDSSGRSTSLAGFAGTGTDPGHNHIDGVGPRARFTALLNSIAVDHAGVLYATDGATIRRGLPASAPFIGTQPASLSAHTGSSVTFTVTATGTPAPTYQWQINGQPFSGATSNTLTLTNVRPEDAGDYTVVVTNDLGSVTSSKATLTVTAASTPPPAGGGGNTGGGGGGAPSVWFVAVAVALSSLRRLRRG